MSIIRSPWKNFSRRVARNDLVRCVITAVNDDGSYDVRRVGVAEGTADIKRVPSVTKNDVYLVGDIASLGFAEGDPQKPFLFGFVNGGAKHISVIVNPAAVIPPDTSTLLCPYLIITKRIQYHIIDLWYGWQAGKWVWRLDTLNSFAMNVSDGSWVIKANSTSKTFWDYNPGPDAQEDVFPVNSTVTYYKNYRKNQADYAVSFLNDKVIPNYNSGLNTIQNDIIDDFGINNVPWPLPDSYANSILDLRETKFDTDFFDYYSVKYPY